MAYASASFDPALVAQNSDAASSAYAEADTASSVAAAASAKAAAASSKIAEQSSAWEAGGSISSVVDDTSPALGGDLDMNENCVVFEFGTLSADHKAAGDIINAQAGESLSFGRVCYLKSDNKFWKTDADASATAKGMVAMCLSTVAADGNADFLLRGLARDDSWNWTSAAELFLSTSAGEMSEAAPSSNGDIVRLAGYARDADYIWFEPSKTYIQVSSA